MSPLPTITNSTDSEALVGWTEESPGRGTWTIITSSLFTIFLCTWTAIHPRIHTTSRLFHLHKLAQLVKMIICPEMVCLESLQEWVQARKMMKRSSKVTNGELKMIHAFYIGMLGIRHETDHGHCVLWPSQYAWLLNNKLASWKDAETWGLSEQAIRDKNKADGVIKLAALSQVIWFLLRCIVRTAQQLPISPLETMTLAYVFVVMVTYIFWWLKPKDISTASYVVLPDMTADQRGVFDSLSMEDNYNIDDRLPPKSKNIAWYLFSRDCKDDDVLVMGHERVQDDRLSLDNESMHTLSEVESTEDILVHRSQSEHHISSLGDSRTTIAITQEENKQRKVVTEWDEALYMSKFWPLICMTGAAFGAFHLISWNSEFPTTAECWMWRANALTSVITSILCMQFRAVVLEWEGPLTIVSIGSPVIYLVTRVIMMVQVFAALRAMPASMYDTYVVSNYFCRFS